MKMITANSTGEGRPVYLAPQAVWSHHLTEGQVFDAEQTTELEQALAAAVRDEASVCGAYVIDVENSAEGLRAVSLREKIRAHGPTTGHSASSYFAKSHA